MAADRLRVLIVEDEALIASGLSFCLDELGHETAGITASGDAALAFVEREAPDLILMDINIPGPDGIAVMERLKERYHVPCVFVTGYSDEQLIRRAESVCAYGYIIKPVDVHDLNAAINIAMSRHRELCAMSSSLSQARQALEDRKLIDRAKGILMDTYEMKEAQAMRFLQKKSRELNKKLPALAVEIIEANRNFHA